MGRNILICTVGGSFQPILKAIERTQPDFICFICTGRDPETIHPGSDVQITGKGNIISTQRGAPPSLPNIPVQAGLAEDQFEVLLVPADELDHTFTTIRTALCDLNERFPEASCRRYFDGPGQL